MSDDELLLQTIEAVYASGTDNEHIPTALESINRLLGGAGATFEVVDIPKMQHKQFWSVGIPSLTSDLYVEEFAALNPFLPYASNQPKGKIIWDYQLHDEKEMACHPFYADFLKPIGLQYCIGAVLEHTQDQLVMLYAQRTNKQGHVGEREIDFLQYLCPHFQRAFDVSSRLKLADYRQDALQNTLDWLNDGVALLRHDGLIVYANDALCTFAQRFDGFRIVQGIVEFFSPDTHSRFVAAFETAARIHENISNSSSMEFPAPRHDGTPAYTVALRPIIHDHLSSHPHTDAAVMMFIHDPLARNIAANQMLAELFDLTHAEANLAKALCAGMTTEAYANTRRVSMNTVYTHLRRLREKTKCSSVAELVRKFGEFQVPLRRNKLVALPMTPLKEAPPALIEKNTMQ